MNNWFPLTRQRDFHVDIDNIILSLLAQGLLQLNLIDKTHWALYSSSNIFISGPPLSIIPRDVVSTIEPSSSTTEMWSEPLSAY